MISYDIAGAAAFLQMSESTLAELLKTGEIMAAKHGQRWCFLEDDLVAYHRKQALIQMERMREVGRVQTSFTQVKVKRNAKPVLPDLPTTSSQLN